MDPEGGGHPGKSQVDTCFFRNNGTEPPLEGVGHFGRGRSARTLKTKKTHKNAGRIPHM